MTILASDIKLRASKVMADVPEGGGGPSARVIGWNESNTIFDDVDSIALTTGNVSIRQLHMHVDTPNTSRLLGAHVFVGLRPNDPHADITLAACEPFATRSQISRAIADYLIPASLWNGFLLNNHVQGQRNIQIAQRIGTAPPTVGRTLVLVKDEGLPTEVMQYVRVIKVDVEERDYLDEHLQYGTYKIQVVTCELQNGLAHAFPGTDANRQLKPGTGKTIIRDTTEADAANYYGASTLKAPASVGDLSLRVDSVYSQLVPSSATQVPALDQRPAAQRLLTLATAPRLIEVPATPHARRIKIGQENRGMSYVFSLTPPPEPGSITVTWVGLGNRYQITDDGQGELSGQGVGTVVYATGSLSVTLPELPDVGSAVVVTWGERVAYTNRSSQGAQVRPPEYSFVLDGDANDQGMVEPGSLSIGYTSGGTIYTAPASSSGVFSGDGSGRVDHPSRCVFFRPAHMPDAGSQLLCTYQLSSQQTEIIPAPTPDAGGYITLSLAQQPAAGTVQVQWATAQEVSHTSGGHMSARSYAKNNASAASAIASRQIARPIDSLRSDVQAVVGSASSGAVESGISVGLPFSNAGVPMVRTASTSATDASSTYTTESAQASTTRLITLNSITDNGSGAFGFGMGTVDYTGQQLNLRVVTYGRSTTSYKSDHERAHEFNRVVTNTAGDPVSSSTSGTVNRGGEYGSAAVGDQMLAGSSVVVKYRTGAAVPVSASMAYTPPEVLIDLCPYTTDRIVPGSVRFSWMGEVYEDFEGVLYRGRSASSLGIASGHVDYAAGVATMTDYVVGGNGPGDFTLLSLWTQKGAWRTASAFFMTSASPIAPGQITITATDVAGDLIEIGCDLHGNLSGPHAHGRIEFQSGLAELQFGDFVLDSALSAAEKSEWWYDPADVGTVEPGKIWRPWPVDPASLRYNAVSNFYLPIDPQIIGLDPVRLPQNGRVPIHRKGRITVIGHNDTVAPATYAAGQTIDLGRTRLSHVWLTDANGALITSGYTHDLDAGTIHVDDVSGWAQPVGIEHRVQDMFLCTDVQIDGTIGCNLPLSHAYPVGSVVSSVLVFGTTFARVAQLVDRHNWDGITWADNPPGNPAVATYNDAAHPIVVDNAGALTQRFAIRFLTSSTYELLGEHLGTIAAGNVNTDFAPPNPFNPAAQLMQIDDAGWGGGWVPGNVAFVHTVGAMQSFACIRCIQPNTPTSVDFSFTLLPAGDIDRPPGPPAP